MFLEDILKGSSKVEVVRLRLLVCVLPCLVGSDKPQKNNGLTYVIAFK